MTRIYFFKSNGLTQKDQVKMTKVGTNMLSDTAKRRQKDGNETATSDKVIIRTPLGHFLRYAAMVTLLLTLACTNVWGAVYKTYALSDLTYTSATLTYEVTGLSSNDQKLNKGERKVEVPCASASGTLYLSGTGANSDRYASIWGSNGTAVDASRKIAMTSGYGSGISFTSADILTEGGKYYIIFSNVDGSDYKINAFKYVLSSACGGSTKRIYMKCGSTWCNDNPKFYAHSWGSSDSDVELTLADCETDVYYADIPSGNTSVVFTRQSPSSTGIAWSGSNFWNQSEDITISTNNKFTCTGWNNSKGTFSGGTYSAPTYTVTYNKNGDGAGGAGSVTGSVPTDSNSPYACGSTVTVLGNTGSLALDGYTFAGWNTAPGGGGTSYAANATFTISANTTLYAQWEENASYSVTYNANGATGSVPTDANTYANGATVTVLGKNTLAKTNYGFAGWRTAVSSGTWYVQGQTFAMGSSNVNLYAQWIAEASLVSGTKYQAADLKAAALTSTSSESDRYRAGISTNGVSEILGTGVANGTAGPMEYNTISSTTVDDEAFTSALYFKGTGSGNPSGTGTTMPTSRAIKFRVPASGVLHLYVKGAGAISLIKSGGTAVVIGDGTDNRHVTANVTAGTYYLFATNSSRTLYGLKFVQSCTAPTGLTAASTTAKGTTFTITDGANTNDYEFYVVTSSGTPASNVTPTHTTTNKTLTITDRVAGTTYYAWVRSKCSESNKSDWVALTGNTFTTSTVSVTLTLSNVTETSGAATSGVGGSDYTAVFAADAGYSLPTPTVTIDGNAATSGTDYTWTAGTGTITIPAGKINGNIVITLSSPAAAPSSVAISGEWLYFAGETISLTATPTGGNGPVTYQWYKGGKADGNAIDGATSATYTKASCAYEDAGSYYCKVTCGGSASTWGQSGNAYDVKIPRLYVKTGHNYDPAKTDYGNVDFTRATASTATASISLGANWDYCFNIADGCGHYYGNAGTMQYNNYGPWTTNVNGTDCGLRTTNGATYVFTINYSNWTELKTTVTFPSSNQAADKVIYFDNSERQWTNVYYRIGHTTHVQASAMDKVYGTANLYTFTTTEYNNFMGWHITNATGETGSNTNIYNTVNSPAISEATAHEGGAVTQEVVTVTPTTSRGNGADVGVNNNCEFFNYDITSGMKTDNVAITAPTNGTITVSYTDVNNAAQSFTSGNRDLAHTVILTSVTATPATGYDLSSLTINGNAHTSGNSYTCSGATTIAASFTLKQTTITIDANTANHGSTTPGSVTATYGSALPSFTAATGASGWNLTGYFTEATSGTKVINANGTLVASTDYADGSGNWKYETATLTLYPQYEAAAPTPGGDCGEIIKSTFSGTKNTSSTPSTTTFNTTGEIGGTSTSAIIGDNGKLNNDGAYLILKLSTGTFLAGDTIKISSDKSGGVKFATGTVSTQTYTLIGTASTATSGGQPYYFVLAANADSIIVPRTSSDYNQNPKIAYVSVCRPCPECDAAPSAPTATSNGATAATTQVVSWTDGSNDKWDVYVSTSSSTPAAGVTPTASGLTAKTYTFTGLTASTAYYWWVRSVCDDTHKSSWFAGSSFTTTSTPAGTTYYLVTSTAQLNTTDTYVIMADDKSAMMGVATGSNNYLNKITSGFTVAGDKSTVTVTSSDVNTLKLKAESTAWNLFGKDSHYITTNSTVNGNLYGNATSGSGTDDFVFSFADGKVTIKRNTTTDYHIYYSSGTGFNQSTSSTNIRLYTSNSTPVYTVTYDLNGGTGTVPTNRPEKSGTSITLASSTGLTKDGFTFDGWLCSVNSIKYAAGASYTMTAANTTFTAQWEAVSGYTVTYNYNGATGGASPASATGASVTLPTPTRTGYELDGWYTTAGTKAGIGGASYEPEADITLYARWQVACDGSGTDSSIDDVAATGYTTYQEKGGSNVVFTSAPSIGFKYKDADGNTINNSTTVVVRNNAYKCQISSDSGNKGSIKTNSTFSNVDSISFYFAASDKGGCKIAVWCSTDDFSADSTQLLSATTYADNNSEFKLKTLAIPSGKKASALRFKFRFTVTSSGKTSYIDSLKIYSSTASSGTCYHVYYHGNGAESGFVSDTTSYADGAKATVLSYNDSRYPLTREDYEFRGWATSAGGSAAYSDGQKITIDGADVHLYAVWAAETEALVTWTMKTNTGDWTATATSTTDGTNIGSIATARTAGGTGSYEGATAKVTMADAEVTGSAAPSNSANFTFTIKSSTKQVEINKFDCQVFNVSSGSRTYKAQISDAAGNVYNSTNTVPVTASATLTDASFVFGSGKILRGAVTIRVYAWGSGSEFRMGPDVKFYGTVEDYECATPSAPTISGSSEYAVGQTITLTASHDGENYDNLTTYTWYRGADWATASAASPVQAAATGAAGYTLTKTAVAADDALFWCKVSNGTCEAHNTTGYNVNVYAANTITWHLNDGTWGEVEHKDSYTRFDDDYTLPIPSKDGYVFAGWYEASDFSGVPAVVLESGSIGDKEYWAKWGTEVTVGWTVTKVDDKLYRGGGGYSITAVINQADWDDYGDKDDLVLTATEGVTLKNVVKSINGDGKAQVFADFDITTELAANATQITFTLTVPAAGTYAPAELTHDEALTDCSGGVVEVRFLSSEKNDAGENFADMENGSSQLVGNGIAKVIATSTAGLNDANNKIGYRADRVNVVFELTTTSDLDIYFNANSTGKSFTLYSFSSAKELSAIETSDYSSKTKITSVTAVGAAFASSGKSTTAGVATVSSGVVNISTAGGIKATYASLAAGYYVFIGSSDGYLYGFDVDGGAGGGGPVTPTLTWDDGDEDIATTGVSKNTSDDGFVYTASQDKNSLGAITYSSSNTAVATVNASTGEVHLEGAAGNATITATIAASGCFDESSISYTITVVDDCDDVAGTISTEDLGCDGIKMTITGHTAAAGVSYQWYKEGSPDETVGTDQDNYTATAAGSYYVIVTNTGDRHCEKRSRNTVTVEAQAAATATKIIDSWYVKNGRRTPDVELVQTTNAESFTVTNKGTSAVIWNSDSTVTTGFGGCGFHLGENGIIYLNGTKDNGDAPSGLTGATDVTLTITAIGCGGNQSKDITIHCQAETTRPSIAFVVDGTKGGAWDAVTSGHASGTDLYDYLDYTRGGGNFDLTERNIYSTTDEKAIREHYSQFDAILITDDPSTDTKDGGKPSKSYVNAFGTMIDVRPILTMEAYVSKWSNWSAKGIAGNPQSPNPRQYEIRLECKDHEIYKAGLPDPEDGTNVWEEVIDGETFRHVILVDSTKGIYNGVAYNVETAGDKKPALQGFTGEAAGSLLGLGRILEGRLQAAIERQEEPAARLLVMGINAKALHETSALTPEGKIILRNILTYLLKTNMEEVDDCSNYFTGKIDNDWSNIGNWSKSALPSTEAKVRILAPCVVSGSHPHVAQVAIVSSGKSSIRETATGSPDCNGSLTINANGALIVEGEVLAAEAPHFAANDLKPTTVNDLIINTNGSGQAALIFDNEEAETQATVNLYSLGKKPSNYEYQYFAVPMEVVPVNPVFANETHGGTGIYTYVYSEASSGWTRRKYYDDLFAFEGLGITTKSTVAMNYTMTGNLASTATKEITLTHDGAGLNLVGNSWMAPIQIGALAEDNDVDGLEQTVYIYCAGRDAVEGAATSGETETAGQWIAIPFEAAEFGTWKAAGKLSVIPAMQAFQIKVSDEAMLTLDYDKVVRGSTNDLNAKLRAPGRRMAANEVTMTNIRVADSKTHTDLSLFEGDRFSEAFDNGWEAEYMNGDGRSAKLYAETEAGQMAVAAMYDYEGTVVGFAPGQETEYTFSFMGEDNGYYLNDIKLQNSVRISEGETYTFTYEEGDAANRFYISRTAINAPSITTGMENLDAAAPRVQKIIYNDKLYIIRGGRLYDATGKVVK